MNPYAESMFDKNLSAVDPVIHGLIEAEERRQAQKIILIPSESVCPAPVLEALGSAYNNVYAEGYIPSMMDGEDEEAVLDTAYQLARYRRYADRRFYKGCEYANIVEALASRRAARLFATGRNPAGHLHVNVQALSGSVANSAVYDVFVRPGDTVMGMSLMHGGHLTHGSEFNRSGRQYRIVSYEVDSTTQRLDYDRIAELAREHRPRMIIAGYTSYPWAPDWKRFREICDDVGAVLFADIAHTAGMVAAGAQPSPIDYADVVTCTTHKSLFGPRGALIITADPDYADLIDQAVFPGEQGGPHVNKFAAMAVAFGLAETEPFRETQHRTVKNAGFLAESLQHNGLRLAYGGTDTHLVLVDLKGIHSPGGHQLLGETAVRVLDLAGIVANKNTIPGDLVTAEATGVRMGTPWITQRGITEQGLGELSAVIGRLLQGIHPFSYIGLTGSLPRGKLELSLLRESKEQVSGIARTLAAQGVDEVGAPASRGVGEIRTFTAQSVNQSRTRAGRESQGEGAGSGRDAQSERACISFLIRGERAQRFLQILCTGNMVGIAPGAATQTLLLDPDGQLIAPVTVGRTETDGEYLLTCRETEAEAVVHWISGNSDGYVLFDRDDLFRKVDGPVAIEKVTGTAGTAGRSGADTAAQSAAGTAAQLPTGPRPGATPAQLLKTARSLIDLSKPYFVGMHALEKTGGAEEQTDSAADTETGGRKKVFTWEGAGSGWSDSADKGQGPEGQSAARRESTVQGQGPVPSCLYNEHLNLGASMVDFAGWNMPVRYGSIIEEHRAVRERAGLFDISHMGVIEISGEGAEWFLDTVCSNYIPWIGDGESQYGYFLDVDGGVIDDVMVYRDHKKRYILVVNAANSAEDLAWLEAVNRGEMVIDRGRPGAGPPSSADIRNLKDLRLAGPDALVNLALQGPCSRDVLAGLSEDEQTARRIRRLQKNRFTKAVLVSCETLVSRTGYTGEDVGYELLVHPDRAPDLWNSILKAGGPHGVVPVGLAARDSLRTEAGLPLHGHELAGPYGIDPVEAGFGPYVKFHKPFFVGRQALLEKMNSSSMSIVRFTVENRGVRPLKTHDWVLSGRTQQVIGNVTSCAVGSDGTQVGMAYVDKRHTREGLAIGVIPAPPGGGTTGGGGSVRHELSLGKKFPLPVSAVITPRFPNRD